ncbi:NADPH-dependent FMN reductase [Tamaricihabitans halophyticus]|uniref:NADPH-dependent FMN reductase n=1 Tax=Tamaricihabitans halophyticus TaxID=1262583 RepID=A0A4R2QYH6_9PSEU|nr:flavodoxin family protein [Tamaricihabitans halophyticus]TCP55300.1 NADPH-dependent FMN reductase [Tamaricihabitans halophyticus]
MRVLALSSSPRKDGNSRMLAEAVLSGAASNGHQIDLVDLADVVRAPLRDCRTCRLSDGRCGIDDEYEELLRGKVADADAWIFATPLYWYGIAGQLKIFIDRLFCYTSSGNPDFADMIDRLKGKRFAVALTAEESYPGAVVGATAQLQELARYLRHEFVGVVRGVANSRGEVQRDPAKPMDQAYALGARLFDGIVSDYRVDSERSGVIWPTGAA